MYKDDLDERGGSRCICHKKCVTMFFLKFFLSLTYFTECQWFISKKIIISPGSRGAPTFFTEGGGGGGGGGPTFSRGRSNCLFPIETHIHVICVFPGGSWPLVPRPSGSAHAIFGST